VVPSGLQVVIMTLFTFFFIPETKGLLIEDVHEVFAAHWFWKRLGAVAHHKVRFSDLVKLGGRRCLAGVLCIQIFLQRCHRGHPSCCHLGTLQLQKGSVSLVPHQVFPALSCFPWTTMF